MRKSTKQFSVTVPIEQIEAELAAQHSQKKSWAGNLAMLAVSLVLFASAGLFNASLYGVMIIVLVLLIHELGHLIGMKIFHYRDVQIFFIPFFGAAVSGSEVNPSGAKRAIVALLGPLPGLVIGAFCGVFYLLSGTLFAEGGLAIFRSSQDIYAELARTFLFINAFNLLPMLPLDGGRVLEAVLFSRNAKIALAFQIFTVMALVGLAVALSSFMLGLLAFFELATMKIAYHNNQIAVELKQELSYDVPKAGSHIPRSYLERIIPRLENTLPAKHRTPKLLAAQAQAIWQKLQCQAPKISATIGLMLFHLFSLAGGVLLTIGFETFAQKPTFLGEKVWKRPSDNASIEATILEMRPILYADMSLQELAASSRGQHRVFDSALEFIDSGKLHEAHETLDAARIDSVVTNNPWYWMLFAYVKQQLEDLAGSGECARKILELRAPESRTILFASSILRELGEKPGDELTDRVLGVGIEVGRDGTVEIVIAYEDGTSRLLFGTGTGLFGDIENSSNEMIIAAKNLVQAAQSLVSQTVFEELRQLPNQGQVRFVFLTGNGIRSLAVRLEQLEKDGQMALRSLWLAAQELQAPLQKLIPDSMK